MAGSHDVWRSAGVDPKRDLKESCADFYILERLAFEGDRSASVRLSVLENTLAREFARYFMLACAGEARHARNMETDGEYRTCWTCDGNGESESDEECPVEDCTEHHYIICGRCDGEGVVYRESEIDDSTLPSLWFEWNAEAASGGRTACYREWLGFYEKHGAAALDMLVDVFEVDGWAPGFGGEAWAGAARLVRSFLSGHANKNGTPLKARHFVNMAWSVKHNGGPVWDKCYSTDGIMQVLEIQADDNYEALARYCSREVRVLWEKKRRAYRAEFCAEWLGVQDTWTDDEMMV